MRNCIQSVWDVGKKDKTEDLSHSLKKRTKPVNTIWVKKFVVLTSQVMPPHGHPCGGKKKQRKNTATSTKADRRWRQDTVAVEMWNTLGRSATGHPCTSQSHSRMSHSVPVHLARCMCVEALFMPAGFRLSHNPVSLMWPSSQLEPFSSGLNSSQQPWFGVGPEYLHNTLLAKKTSKKLNKNKTNTPINPIFTTNISII